MANWTIEDGAGRPLTKGTGKALSDLSQPLIGARAFTASRRRMATPAPDAITHRTASSEAAATSLQMSSCRDNDSIS